MTLRLIGALGLSLILHGGLTRSVGAQATTTTTTSSQVAGVSVDAQGVLRMHMHLDRGGTVARQRIAAAKSTLGLELSAPSKLRMISRPRPELPRYQRQLRRMFLPDLTTNALARGPSGPSLRVLSSMMLHPLPGSPVFGEKTLLNLPSGWSSIATIRSTLSFPASKRRCMSWPSPTLPRKTRSTSRMDEVQPSIRWNPDNRPA